MNLSSQLTSRPKPAAVDEHETVAVLRVLVGELHRHPAAEGLAHDRRVLHVEHAEQIPDAAA